MLGSSPDGLAGRGKSTQKNKDGESEPQMPAFDEVGRGVVYAGLRRYETGILRAKWARGGKV